MKFRKLLVQTIENDKIFTIRTPISYHMFLAEFLYFLIFFLLISYVGINTLVEHINWFFTLLLFISIAINIFIRNIYIYIYNLRNGSWMGNMIEGGFVGFSILITNEILFLVFHFSIDFILLVSSAEAILIGFLPVIIVIDKLESKIYYNLYFSICYNKLHLNLLDNIEKVLLNVCRDDEYSFYEIIIVGIDRQIINSGSYVFLWWQKIVAIQLANFLKIPCFMEEFDGWERNKIKLKD